MALEGFKVEVKKQLENMAANIQGEAEWSSDEE